MVRIAEIILQNLFIILIEGKGGGGVRVHKGGANSQGYQRKYHRFKDKLSVLERNYLTIFN